MLIFGRHGQLARALRLSLLARGQAFEVVGSAECDLIESPEGCARRIKNVSAVINASAFTDVDGAQSQTHANRQLNAHAPGIMAVACAKAGVPFVHVSTDYVFSGQGVSAIKPSDPVGPINAYGKAKLAGERAVRAVNGNSLILRTSGLHDGVGKNFLTSMARLRGRGNLQVVDDQIGRPTQAGHLAEAILHALKTGWTGTQIHHVQNGGAPVSWADFAQAIFASLGGGPRIERIASRDYPTAAQRPQFSVLDTVSFEAQFGYGLQDWRDGLDLSLWELSNREGN